MHGKQTDYWLTLKYKIDFFNNKITSFKFNLEI